MAPALIPPEVGQAVVADLQARFDRLDVAYKTVSDTPIKAAIFVPTTLSSKTDPAAVSVPVLVHLHGGALVMGGVPEPFFLTQWIRDLAHSTPAIFVSVGYRLAPETPAVDILDDVSDFWAWLRSDQRHFTTAVHSRWPHVTPDLARVAVAGESAGGYLALQSALLFNRTAKVRAVIAQYPALYTDLAAFNQRPAEPDPALDALVADYLENAKPGTVRWSTPWPEAVGLLVASLQNGHLRDLFGRDEQGRLTLQYALAQAEELPPPIWVVQGEQDSFVATKAVDEFVDRLRKERPNAAVRYTVQPGDHGFDGPNTLEDEWVKEGVEFVKKYWL